MYCQPYAEIFFRAIDNTKLKISTNSFGCHLVCESIMCKTILGNSSRICFGYSSDAVIINEWNTNRSADHPLVTKIAANANGCFIQASFRSTVVLLAQSK